MAVTGFVQSDEGWLVVLENLETQEGRLVRPGDEGFGYRVQSVDMAKNQVFLEKDGQVVQLFY